MKRSIKPLPDTLPGDMLPSPILLGAKHMSKTYTCVEMNIAQDVANKAKPKAIRVPPNMIVKVDLTLEDDGYKELVKDPSWAQRVQQTAKKKLDGEVVKIADVVAKADAKAAKFNEAQAKLFEKDLQSAIEKSLKTIADEMAKEVDNLVKNYVKDQAEYKKYKVKSAGKIVLGVVGVVGSAVAIGASHGAASPMAIISLTRSCVAVTQTIVKLALEAEGVEKLIKADMAVLKKLIGENEKNPKLKAVKEIGLNALSSVLGVETPSLKNCDGRLELYKNKISGLEKQSKELSVSIPKIMDANKALEDKIKAAKSTDPKIQKLQKALGLAEDNLNTVLEKTIAINERILKALARHEAYSKALEAMKKGVPGWTKYVDTVISLGIDLGLGISDAGTALEKGLSAVISIENLVADQLMEHT